MGQHLESGVADGMDVALVGLYMLTQFVTVLTSLVDLAFGLFEDDTERVRTVDCDRFLQAGELYEAQGVRVTQELFDAFTQGGETASLVDNRSYTIVSRLRISSKSDCRLSCTSSYWRVASQSSKVCCTCSCRKCKLTSLCNLIAATSKINSEMFFDQRVHLAGHCLDSLLALNADVAQRFGDDTKRLRMSADAMSGNRSVHGEEANGIGVVEHRLRLASSITFIARNSSKHWNRSCKLESRCEQ